jgi:hypothetical protein
MAGGKYAQACISCAWGENHRDQKAATLAKPSESAGLQQHPPTKLAPCAPRQEKMHRPPESLPARASMVPRSQAPPSGRAACCASLGCSPRGTCEAQDGAPLACRSRRIPQRELRGLTRGLPQTTPPQRQRRRVTGALGPLSLSNSRRAGSRQRCPTQTPGGCLAAVGRPG